jgi:lysophospholipase L1-like esterase
MKFPLARLWLPVLGVCIGLLLAEAISRVIYVRPWYEQLLDEQKASFQGAAVHTNVLGLRGRSYLYAKSSNTRRVLILGDSFTFGQGVADDSAVFPALLERELAAELAARGQAIEVLNGGIPGSQTSHWVDLLAGVKGEFQPDVILIVFFLRDGTRTTSMTDFFGPIRDRIVTRNRSSALYQGSYLYRLMRDMMDRSTIAASYTKALNDGYFGTGAQTGEWRIAQQNILRIAAVGRESGARVGLVIFPVLAELNKDYPFQAICDELMAFGRTNGIETLDLLPAFIGKNGPELWVSAQDQHPNAVAHRIAADAMRPFLGELIGR